MLSSGDLMIVCRKYFHRIHDTEQITIPCSNETSMVVSKRIEREVLRSPAHLLVRFIASGALFSRALNRSLYH